MIPRTQTLKVEDFPEQQGWIEPLIRAVNSGATQTSAALSRSLTFGENLNATLQAVEVTLRPDWQSPSLENSWIALAGEQPPQYRRVGDRVELRGGISTGTVATAAFTLPEGFRPPGSLRFATTSNALFGDFTISTSGVVTPAVGSNASFWIGCEFAVDPPNVPNGAFPVKFTHKLSSGAKPVGCWVIAVRDLTGSGRNPASGSGYVAWRPNGAEVIVDDVPGLVAGHKYSITFLVSGG